MSAAGGPRDAARQSEAEPDTFTRGERILHKLLLVWGGVMAVAVLVGVVGFLVYFFLLPR